MNMLYSIHDGVLNIIHKYGVLIARISLGIIYIWFGVLKYFPGLSPAEELVEHTITFISPDIFIPLLATWEVVIGLLFLIGRPVWLAFLLLILHMPGTFLPLVVLPDVVWIKFPYAWTLEGQYIIKNLALISSALFVASLKMKSKK